MELRRYLAVLRRRRRLIIVSVLVAVFAAWQFTPTSVQYVANTTIFVGTREYDNIGGDGLTNERLAAFDRVAATYSLMLESQPIAVDALERTGIARSAASVVASTTAQPQFGTQLVEVSVVDPDPVVAQRLADGLADALIEKIQTFEPSVPSGEGDVPAVPAYVFAPAQLPLAPVPNERLRALILAAVFGFLASTCFVFLLEYLDITVRSAEDAEHRLGLPVLGVVPMRSSDRPTPLIGSRA